MVTVDITRRLSAGALLMGVLAACTASIPAETPDSTAGQVVVFGRIITVLTAPSSRSYEPKVSFFELLNRGTGDRIHVEINSNDKLFVLPLPVGDYEVTRVQIHEGPFASMADLALTFHAGPERLGYLGTWKVGVDRPRNDRQLLVSVGRDPADQEEAERYVAAHHAELSGQAVTVLVPVPAAAETELHEVMPYPRVVPYFRRHW